MEKLYIDVPKQDTLRNFIIKCFTSKTFYGETSLYKCRRTYYNKDLSDPECHIARRSFEDILRIVNTVYDNISEKELAETMYDLYKNSVNDRNFVADYCPDIQKVVFKFMNSAQNYCNSKCIYKLGTNVNNKMTEIYFEENGIGKYSLKDILDLAGHKDNYLIANGEKQF